MVVRRLHLRNSLNEAVKPSNNKAVAILSISHRLGFITLLKSYA